MKRQKVKFNLFTYTILINAFMYNKEYEKSE